MLTLQLKPSKIIQKIWPSARICRIRWFSQTSEIISPIVIHHLQKPCEVANHKPTIMAPRVLSWWLRAVPPLWQHGLRLLQPLQLSLKAPGGESLVKTVQGDDEGQFNQNPTVIIRKIMSVTIKTKLRILDFKIFDAAPDLRGENCL